MAKVDFSLYLITDRHQAGGRDLLAVVEGALAGGVRCVQLREKDLPARTLLELARAMRRLTDRFGARLLINDRVDIALAAGADGVHLGEEGMPAAVARELLGSGRLIGVSCHGRGGAAAAVAQGADFITFGPVYPTPSKAAYGEPVGIDQLAATTKEIHIPVFALGGIKEANIPEALAAGAAGVALISAIIADPDPRERARALLALLPPRTRDE
ncbi:thiamine phosphate synthase [Geobacter sulfurreducens]|uniref:Putative thiamine-phosphate synthase n=1 Tax=Geobacter sulfurreducens (strain ATCC 51573 / DSM 12127 / PCA) TaxID=243231 RepID=THIE_GEOSL|nr:thiamine phosphate synthase [Geobacter sulfurreducens]P61411.1 RecName: Full=Putative thiamine-phosphate synthase; Short=TP synthase; Short=TPS; AltName: Full=Thiamine-phosphate pyrophosphorylase; Short=TMP pyrophosphorylase; Short=TMP-PPase [Geobacter sulfurreducens PCA]AAR33918.1 carboxythiazole phosphate tautomerase [Geobacter sulfurreducens PCA]ADI83428.1 carboxythiazole phosphate tautomerase [Geobacter sulfurreducens KN400]AJY70342.1 thiamine-phosphate synthase [Geobacter sulfurreducens